MDSAGTTTVRYTTGLDIDELISRTSNETRFYYHRDGLGSITALTDTAQNLAATYKYDAFGIVTTQTGTINNPYKFTARELDIDSGLYYFRARYYEASLGRFITRTHGLLTKERLAIDIKACTVCKFSILMALSNIFIAKPELLHAYIYCINNPVINTDPLGDGLLDCFRFLYYAVKCAKKGLKCREKIEREIECEGLLNVLQKYNAAYPDDLLFKVCYANIPECQKKYEYGVKCAYWIPKPSR